MSKLTHSQLADVIRYEGINGPILNPDTDNLTCQVCQIWNIRRDAKWFNRKPRKGHFDYTCSLDMGAIEYPERILPQLPE